MKKVFIFIVVLECPLYKYPWHETISFVGSCLPFITGLYVPVSTPTSFKTKEYQPFRHFSVAAPKKVDADLGDCAIFVVLGALFFLYFSLDKLPKNFNSRSRQILRVQLIKQLPELKQFPDHASILDSMFIKKEKLATANTYSLGAIRNLPQFISNP